MFKLVATASLFWSDLTTTEVDNDIQLFWKREEGKIVVQFVKLMENDYL